MALYENVRNERKGVHVFVVYLMTLFVVQNMHHRMAVVERYSCQLE
jgi:hypothetical protein